MRATKVNAGLAESKDRLLLGIWRDSLHVTCGLTACTPGSAPGPTLGNEYGKTLPFFLLQKLPLSSADERGLQSFEMRMQKRTEQISRKGGKKVYDEQELEVDGKHGGIYSMLEGA